jgi:hypothetical protein
MRRRWKLIVLVMVLVAGYLAFDRGTGFVIAVLIFYGVLTAGLWMLRGFGMPVMTPPPAGEMRRTNLRYRCSICGVEIKMTAAPNEDPEPPRHCLEDMELVTPAFE